AGPRPRSLSGKRERPTSLKTPSMSCGISPASSFAANSAWRDSAAIRASHPAAGIVFTRMVMSYGLGRDPWTFARTSPFSTSLATTWPFRAYDRPPQGGAPAAHPHRPPPPPLAPPPLADGPAGGLRLDPPLGLAGTGRGREVGPVAVIASSAHRCRRLRWSPGSFPHRLAAQG